MKVQNPKKLSKVKHWKILENRLKSKKNQVPRQERKQNETKIKRALTS